MSGGLARVVSAVGAFPAVLFHELVHAALTLPWVNRVAIIIDGDSYRMRVVPDEYREETPGWALVVAHLGPTILGGMMGVSAAGYVLVTGRVPRTALEWLLGGVLGLWWTIFTMPSRDDRRIPTTETMNEPNPDTDTDTSGGIER